jgi:hypothetical protein
MIRARINRGGKMRPSHNVRWNGNGIRVATELVSRSQYNLCSYPSRQTLTGVGGGGESLVN